MFVTKLHSQSVWSFVVSSFLIVTFSIVVGSETKCNDTSYKCCDGYFWSFEYESCEKCTPGHIGPNCTDKCPYPTYGDLCNNVCTCSTDMCDVSTGCIAPTKEENVSSEITFFENATTHITYISSSKKYSGTGMVNGVLPLLLKLFGFVDIVLLSAYLVLCVFDRYEQEKTSEFAPQGSHFSEPNSAYENVEVFSVFSLSNN